MCYCLIYTMVSNNKTQHITTPEKASFSFHKYIFKIFSKIKPKYRGRKTIINVLYILTFKRHKQARISF